MSTDSVILSLYFETPLHAASGSVLGPIDLPIQRERTTQWPLVYATTLEDALRAAFAHTAEPQSASELFSGEADALSVSDARLLFFPVRSSVAPFLWLTCPAVLNRLRRDLARTVGIDLPPAPAVKSDEIVTTAAWKHGQEALSVEDVVLKPRAGLNMPQLLQLVPTSGQTYEGFDKELEMSLGLVSDEVFSLLVRTATEVLPAVQTGDEAITVLQELVPADALFYVPVSAMGQASAVERFEKLLAEHLRVGEGLAFGRGWARTALLKANGGAQ